MPPYPPPLYWKTFRRACNLWSTIVITEQCTANSLTTEDRKLVLCTSERHCIYYYVSAAAAASAAVTNGVV